MSRRAGAQAVRDLLQRWLLAATLLAPAVLTGCDRQPVKTVVIGPAQRASAAAPPLGGSSRASATGAKSRPAGSAGPATSGDRAETAAFSASAITAAAAQRSAPAMMADPPVPPLEADRGDGPALLAQRRLLVPVKGVAAAALIDTFNLARGGRRHEAIDIMAPRGTPVLAVDDGKLVKLFTSAAGGLTAYQFDSARNLAYYYAHLDRYADGLKEGLELRRGDLIGTVGSTGNAAPDAPHLHFAVFRLGPQREWWKGVAVNPYPALRQATASQ